MPGMNGGRGVLPSAAPTRAADGTDGIRLTDEQQQVVGNRSARLRVLAGPGTGKTTTIVEAVAERIESGVCAADQVLVLTYSRPAAAELSARIVRRLRATTRTPLVRTLHSYAYSLARADALRRGEPAPRLLAAGESDQVIRELLAGNLQDGGRPWPAFLHGALRLHGFARSVRDLLSRTTERGLHPAALVAAGRRHHRPEWVALGRFAGEYAEVLDLRSGTTRQGQALDQAELIGVALGLLRVDAVLAAEQARVRRLFVDEYQDVDPAQAALVEALAGGCDEVVLVGDPDQSVYGFRGSDPRALRAADALDTVTFTAGQRLPASVVTATRRVAALLPGPAAHRDLSAANGADEGRVDVRVLPTAGAEAAFIADQLRRAHLLDEVPWARMAVLVRSPAASLPALRRAFAIAKVPLTVPGRSVAMTEDPLVAALLLVLVCGSQPMALTAERATELLSSPLIGVDALGVRRLRIALRGARPGQGSSADLIASALVGAELPADLTGDLSGPVLRLRALLALVDELDGTVDAEQLLWQVWQATEQEPGLLAASERGGLAGQRADASLDAVLQLFELAAERVSLVPGAGLADLLEAALGRGVDEDARRPDRSAEAVPVISAHAAKGLEWDVVAVAGVQEGSWPAAVRPDDLLGGQDLLDLAAGLPVGGSRAAEVLAEERRLFYVAATRARRHLLVTAVLDTDTQPSRFLAELAGTADLPTGRPVADRASRGLNSAELIADLRRAVCDPALSEELRQTAAGHLATLAGEQFRAADPDRWWGLATPSTTGPVTADGERIRVSPSQVESVLRCALRAGLERLGGRSAQTEFQVEGIVAHALANGIALGLPHDDLVTELDGWLAASGSLAPWQLARQRTLLVQMLTAAREWYAAQHPPWQLVGSEQEVGADLDTAPGGRPVRIAGRVDVLTNDESGRPVVVDFKTSATMQSVADAAQNPQLATYQLALSAGAGTPTGGARLVYLRTGTPVVREQPPLTDDQRDDWSAVVRSVAEQLAAPGLTATVNRYCDVCVVRTSCPVHVDGRQVTG